MEDSEYIVDNPKDGTVTIAGCFRINGQVMDTDVTKCAYCNSEVIYYDDYDAYICAYCNKWLEKKCGDANCRYCLNRPEKPLPNDNELRRLKYT